VSCSCATRPLSSMPALPPRALIPELGLLNVV
jgi:hypothetical protein